MDKSQTTIKILNAFSDLLIEKGYQGATTKLVAKESGVNESTVFRHFGDKRGLLNDLVDEYMKDLSTTFSKMNKVAFETNDIEAEMILMAKFYLDFMNQHKAISLLNDPSFPPEALQASNAIKLEFKKFVKSRINRLVVKGEISKNVDVETETINFIFLNFGFMVVTNNSRDIANGLMISENVFLEKNIRSFAKHLKSVK